MDITEISQRLYDLADEVTRLRSLIEADTQFLQSQLKTHYKIQESQLVRNRAAQITQLQVLASRIKGFRTAAHGGFTMASSNSDFQPAKIDSVDSVSGGSRAI